MFAIRAFRALWLADLVSLAGDRIARVGMAVLVYQRTGSALLAALTIALTFIPALFGPVLAGIADRYPRRAVMIAADSLRAILTLFMAVPALPTVTFFTLLILVSLMAAPHAAARNTILRWEILNGETRLFETGEAIRGTTYNVAQLTGFGVGGLVAGIDPHIAVLSNALSFVISAGLTLVGVPRSTYVATRGDSYWALLRTTGHTLWESRPLKTLAWLAWLTALSFAPEALAVPYAAEIGGSPVAAGLLTAADSAGVIVGIFLLKRILPLPATLPWMAPLAALSGVPLILALLEPPLALSMLLFAIAGACSSYLWVAAGPAFQHASPKEYAAGLMGWHRSGMFVMQGLIGIVAGILASAIGTGAALALIGVVAVAAGAHGVLLWQRAAGAYREITSPPASPSPYAS